LPTSPESLIAIYFTASSAEEGRRIARELVSRRAVACANIISQIESIYWWEDKIEQDQEVAVLCKSRSALFESARKIIVSLHSYDVPCITSWQLTKVSADYAAWIYDQTR